MKDKIKRIFNSNIAIVILLLAQILLLFNWQFSDWPEMYSYPYLINNGYKLYQDIINPYTPLLPLVLASYYKLFSLSLLSLKIATIVTILLIDILIVLYLKSAKYKNVSLLLLIYILWQSILEGNGLWFDLALTPLILASFLLMAHNKLHFAHGLILGTAFLIKQTAAIYILLCLIVILFKFKSIPAKLKNMGMFIAGVITPLIVASIYLIKNQITKDFIFWALLYPFGHLRSAGFALLPTPKQILVIIFFILPLILLLRFASIKKVQLLLAYSLASIIFSLPRFSYFHLQPLIPFVIFALAFLHDRVKSGGWGKLAINVYLIIVIGLFALFFTRYYGQEPRFNNKRTINYINELRKKLDTTEPVFFYNTSSEYFALASLLPPKPWADTFPWYLEVPSLQERITKSLDDSKVRYIVFQPFGAEGDRIPGSYIPQSLNQYIKINFTVFTQVGDNLWILQR